MTNDMPQNADATLPPDVADPDTPSHRGKSPTRHLWRAGWGATVTLVLIGMVQSYAPSTDHQMANFASFAVGLFGILFVAYQLHRYLSAQRLPLLVPLVTLAVLLGQPVLYRFDGFSGEMLPQFQPRFWGAARLDRAAMENESDLALLAPSDITQCLEPSLGFLGNDRTGVISERQFAIPTAVDQVETLWDQGVGEGWSAFAVSGDRAVTLEQRDAKECVTCYRLGDGKLNWIVEKETRHENPLGGVGPRSTPQIEADRVYASGATGMLWCIDLMTGKTIWTVDLLDLAGWDQPTSEQAIPWGRSASPLLVEGLCIVPFGGPADAGSELAKAGRTLIALDAETGDIRWTTGEDQISYASPVLMTLAGEKQVVSVNESNVGGYRISDGTRLWSFDWPGNSNADATCTSAMPAGPNRFVVGKGYSGGSAIVEITAQSDEQQSDGQRSADVIWASNRVLKTKFTHACLDGETLYALSDGSLQAVRSEDGKRLWQQPRSDRAGQGQILLASDTIVMQTEPGEVVFVEAAPTQYNVLFRLPALSAKTWNLPTLAGRHLLVRNDREVICFLLPPLERS
ncbi:outer membrane protein assembly factor BamB family protein [Novipirellula artificiosorum]|uniref:outer membrane protein assembly factor BamB family protein n=1 Tax=Novipirellula artificiosorum TaxID=2528016 RepID=UPI001E50F842|nr:PQQ-binding-like beta-propeller repeat protein [Novipirellula artificiosorum]